MTSDGIKAPCPDEYEKERIRLTPASGFELVGIDFFAGAGQRLYAIEHFEMYGDALAAKKSRKNPEEYFVLYKDAQGRYCHR